MKLRFMQCGLIDQMTGSQTAIDVYGDVFGDCDKRTKKLLSDMISEFESGIIILNEAFFILDRKEFKKIFEEYASKSIPTRILHGEKLMGIFLPAKFSEVIDESQLFYTPEKTVEDRWNDLLHEVISKSDTSETHIGEEVAFPIDSVSRLCFAYKYMNRERAIDLLESGVFVEDIDTLYVSSCSVIEPGAVLGSNVSIKSQSLIKKGALVGSGSQIISSTVGVDSKIHQSSMIQYSTVEDCVEILSSTMINAIVGSFSKIGPYAYLRPNSVIGKNVKIGDFVEVKNSVIGDGTKVSHLSYIGDADVGSNVNVGCGVVFVNYDGFEKHRSVVSDNAFIGCNVNLVAPVFIGENSFIAAGSTITDDVAEKQLAIARARQTNKDGWLLKKKL